MNISPVTWQPTATNSNVALLVGTSALTIANTVDLNATGSTGTTTIGGASTLTTGSSTFSGNVTMQSQSAAVENLVLDITSSTPTGNGIVMAGVISTADPLDLLQVRKVGTGVAELTAINTYGNGTVLANGTLQGTRTATGVGSVFGTGAINVGTTIATQTGDALKLEFLGDNTGVTYTVPSANNIVVGNQNATGSTSIDATNGTAAPGVADVDVLGTVSLGRRVFLRPDANATLQLSGIVSGAGGGITVVDGGTVRLTNGSNTYGSSLGATGTAIDGGTIIRNGTIEVFAASALGTTTIELGDARNNLIAVDRASNGVSLSDSGALFSSGTFTGVDVGFGGGSYGAGPLGTRLLVKDEVNNPERNGVYEITATGATLTLARVADFDVTAEMIYGSTVQATNGVVPNQQYFLTGTVGTPNTNAVLWRDTASNPNVALLAASAITIGNNIDLNASGSTGTTTLGSVSTLTTGSVTFSGTITMQSQLPGTENLTLNLTSDLVTATNTGVTLSNVISDGTDSLQVRKVGAGIATLTGNNTYDGGTVVAAGTLAANNTAGSATGTGAVTVNNLATLAGNGSITPASAANITIDAGGRLLVGAPGHTSGEDLVLTLSGGGDFILLGTVEFQIFDRLSGTPGLTENDVLKVNADNWSDIIFGGASKVKVTTALTSTLWEIGDEWKIFDWVGITLGTVPTPSTNPANYDLPTLSAGKAWDTSKLFSQGVISVAVVPEPGRMLLLLLGVVSICFRRRRSGSGAA